MDTNADAANSSAAAAENPTGSLRTIEMGVPDEAAIDALVPEVRVTVEESGGMFDLDSVSHVVLQVSTAKQEDIFRSVGYHYDWDFPGPFWHFLGKMAAKALYNDEAKLRVLNYVPLGRREFVVYTTSMWTAAVKAGRAAGAPQLPPLNVVELKFKKQPPGQPLEMFQRHARPLVTAKIAQWNADPDEMDIAGEGE